jgi:Nucleoside diphosphate kinase
LYGTDGSQNAVHGSDSKDSAEREKQIIFEEIFGKVPDNETVDLVDEVFTLATEEALPTSVPEEVFESVSEYHSVIEALGEASGGFRPPEEVAQTILQRSELEDMVRLSINTSENVELFETSRAVSDSLANDAALDTDIPVENNIDAKKSEDSKIIHNVDSIMTEMSHSDLQSKEPVETDGPALPMVLERNDAIKACRTLAGPTNSNTARETDPERYSLILI